MLIEFNGCRRPKDRADEEIVMGFGQRPKFLAYLDQGGLVVNVGRFYVQLRVAR